MFKIGEFSKLTQTPITQLRYYDRIGLFQPEHTDRFTGYRYYDASQLRDLHRIMAMKELGLTLDQIKRLIGEDVSAEELRGMLTLKKAQVEQELQSQIGRLHYIEARLRQVEQEGALVHDDVVLKELPAQPIFSFRETLPDVREAIRHRMEISRLLPARISQKKLGHFVAILHEDAFVVEEADVEMGFLLNEAVNEPLTLASGHELQMNILPQVEVAACVARIGGFENGYESYANMGRWLAERNYRISGPIREVFINQAPLDRIDEMVCEIQLPVTLERPQIDFSSN